MYDFVGEEIPDTLLFCVIIKHWIWVSEKWGKLYIKYQYTNGSASYISGSR